jgi:hypothetical protein
MRSGSRHLDLYRRVAALEKEVKRLGYITKTILDKLIEKAVELEEGKHED